MRAYIDDLRIVRIESDTYIYDIHLKKDKLTWFKNENGSQFFFSEKKIELHKEDKIYINHQVFDLAIGLVTLTEDFDKYYRYEGDLGVIYTPKATTFRVFSPVAKAIQLVLADQVYDMSYQDSGVYEIVVEGNHDGKNYFFDVRLQNTFKRVTDPYAKASNLLGPVVVDFKKTQQLKRFKSHIKSYTDAIIYEGHIRDLTIDLDVESKGLYQGLIEYSNSLKKSVIGYIKDLGITHLQLMPVYDFEGVNDEAKDSAYNWGYNPSQYFTLEGWYSKNPDDPYDRILAFKSIIQDAHEKGLSINLDVVYNHVYQTMTFPYDDLVPGYFYRHDKDHKRTDSSYCGNDVETRNYMVRKLIVDNLLFFVNEYKIDGFRFDLMGLLDVDTMLAIEAKLKKINPRIMLYGEGWAMGSAVPNEKRSHKNNFYLFPNYAHFNDDFRDTLRGALHGNDLGYALGNKDNIKHLKKLILGSRHMFDKPAQSINYVECHDNYTFFDRMERSIKADKLRQDLATHLVLIARGIPFLHAGQEFYRTKQGVENAYRSSDAINKVTWPKNQHPITKLKKLIKIRKKYDVYRLNKHLSDKHITMDQNVLILTLKGKDYQHQIYIKNDYETYVLPFEKPNIIFGADLIQKKNTQFVICKPGVYIVEIGG